MTQARVSLSLNYLGMWHILCVSKKIKKNWKMCVNFFIYTYISKFWRRRSFVLHECIKVLNLIFTISCHACYFKILLFRWRQLIWTERPHWSILKSLIAQFRKLFLYGLNWNTVIKDYSAVDICGIRGDSCLRVRHT